MKNLSRSLDVNTITLIKQEIRRMLKFLLKKIRNQKARRFLIKNPPFSLFMKSSAIGFYMSALLTGLLGG